MTRWQHKRAPLGERVHEKGGETEGVFGGDTELRLTCSEKDEMGMSEDLHPVVMIFPTFYQFPFNNWKRK